MKKNILTLIILSVLILGCKSKSVPRELGSYYNYQTMLIDNRDNKILVAAWGKGVAEKDALDDAKRNALEDILFKRISSGSESLLPIFNENASSYINFTNSFFAQNGPYLAYVELYNKFNTTYGDKKKQGKENEKAIKFELLIDRQQLLTDLKNQGLIKK